MSVGWLCVASLSLFFLSQSLLSEAHRYKRGDYDHDLGDRGRCHKLSKAMGPTCEVKEDCGNITCTSNFGGQQVFLSAVINKCMQPKSLGLAVRVPRLGVDWSQTFESGDSITIPEFPLSVEGVVSARVNVKVELEEAEDDKLKIKVELLGGGEVAGHELYPVKYVVMDGELPIDTDDCGEPEVYVCFGYSLSWEARAAILAGCALSVMLAVYVCYHYLCRKPVKEGKTLPGKCFVKPSPDIMTTTKSKVPLERLTSEA